MPSEVALGKSMQRELADSIIRMVPLDEIRILLACGAKVSKQAEMFPLLEHRSAPEEKADLNQHTQSLVFVLILE